MRVGDAADVREHIQNLHLVFFDKRTNKYIHPIMRYRLDVGSNCTAKPTSYLDRPTNQLVFPDKGAVNVYAWTVTAEKPGQCEFVFHTDVTNLFGNINPVTIPVYERFSPADEVNRTNGILSFLGTLAGAYAIVRAAQIARGDPGFLKRAKH
jgi:hypothetical protein